MNIENRIAKRVANIPPSGIRKFFDIVSEMKDAISLGVGEPDFVTPWPVCLAAVKSIEQGETHYTSNWGTIALRREIARYLERRFKTPYRPDSEIVVTVGASEGIDLALRALIEPGDEVLIPEPSYVSYTPLCSLSGGVPVALPCAAEDGFALRADVVKAAITPRTKALVLPYPNNPTGGVMTKEQLSALADVLRGTGVVVISDEIYAELTYGGHKHVSFASLPGMWERTVTINGFSKAFAMTGWRLGYVCAPEPLAAAMCKIHQYAIMCAPTAAQAAAVEALRSGYATDYAAVGRMVEVYDRRRQLMVSRFNDMGLACFEPRGAFYTFPSVQATGMTGTDFSVELLRTEKVACVPGSAFGSGVEGHIRCSCASATSVVEEALVRMERFAKGKIR